MKKLISLSLLMAVVVVFASCESKSEAEEVAERFCECSEPAVEMNTRMEEAGNDPEQLQQIMDTYKEQMNEMIECQTRIQDEYGELLSEPAFEEELRDAIREECPDVFTLLEGEAPVQ